MCRDQWFSPQVHFHFSFTFTDTQSVKSATKNNACSGCDFIIKPNEKACVTVNVQWPRSTQHNIIKIHELFSENQNVQQKTKSLNLNGDPPLHTKTHKQTHKQTHADENNLPEEIKLRRNRNEKINPPRSCQQNIFYSKHMFNCLFVLNGLDSLVNLNTNLCINYLITTNQCVFRFSFDVPPLKTILSFLLLILCRFSGGESGQRSHEDMRNTNTSCSWISFWSYLDVMSHHGCITKFTAHVYIYF